MADGIVAFPRRCLQWRGIVALAPFIQRACVLVGVTASHISRLIVSICRGDPIEQFQRPKQRKSRHYRDRGRPLFVHLRPLVRSSPLGEEMCIDISQWPAVFELSGVIDE